MNKKQITLVDLAKTLGISTATVSRALKNYPDISADTKKRVVELARELNYRPNTMAAGLRKRESKVIGVIIPSIVDHFFSAVIKGIMEVAYEQDYRVMLCQSNEDYHKEVADAQALYASRVDGVLVSVAHGTVQFDHFRDFQEAGVPIVFFDKVPTGLDGTSRVIVDDHDGAFQAVSHLIQQGHRQIAHFRGPLIATTSYNRLMGYRDALAAHGIPYDESLIYACQDITLEEGRQFTRRLLNEHPGCTAIFTVTDTVAIGAMTALKMAGKRIPDEMALIGFSDWAISAIMEPPLSSVSQPSWEMGRTAARLLLDEIHSAKQDLAFSPETVTLRTTLMIRQSSGGA
ncbi:MAG: LacI family DNA-binding transcriptional regulator [Bacteroidia bacterium]|nr:LacI family DNA-binding transcriptional regulator [Bacteroidia bacterium]